MARRTRRRIASLRRTIALPAGALSTSAGTAKFFPAFDAPRKARYNRRVLKRARRFPAGLIVLLWFAAGVSGCVTPLGRGYRFDQREVEVLPVLSDPPHLHILVSDRITNIGNQPLDSLVAELPAGPTFGMQNLRVTVEGEDTEPHLIPAPAVRLYKIPFDPAWTMSSASQQHSVVFEYDLAPQAGGRGTVSVSADDYHLDDPTAFPVWQTPAGVFSKGGNVPIQMTLRAEAPPGDSLAALGVEIAPGAHTSSGERVFKIAADNPTPFVVAGRYVEQDVSASGRTVAFWTFAPLDSDAAQTAARRLGASFEAFDHFFGTAPAGTATIRIVETSAALPAEFGTAADPGAASFPGGVILDTRGFSAGVASESNLQLAEYELARTWFGWMVRPQPQAQILMGRGVGLFAVAIAAEARSGTQERRRVVTEMLSDYEEARAKAEDRPLIEPATGYTREQRVSSGYKAALFFIALEDEVGTEKLRRAMRHLVRAMSGSDVGEEELRSAVEEETGRDFAEFFRTWLNHPGVPAEFLKRYSPDAGHGASVGR